MANSKSEFHCPARHEEQVYRTGDIYFSKMSHKHSLVGALTVHLPFSSLPGDDVPPHEIPV